MKCTSKSARPIEIETGQGAIPIRCFTGTELLPDDHAQRQLRQVAAVSGLQHQVSVLPDVHYKERNPAPTGTIVASRDVLVPRAIDGGVGCGMRAMATGIPVSEFTPEITDSVFMSMIESAPIKYHDQPVLTEEQCEQMLLFGLSELIGPIELPTGEISRVENDGRMFPDLDADSLRRALTPAGLAKAIRKGNGTLGTIGAGNHFLELQEIVELYDDIGARRLGLSPGDAVFMLHTDSRRLGKKLMSPPLARARARFQLDSTDRLWTLPLDHELAEGYLAAMSTACHAGFANRAIVGQMLRRNLRGVFDDDTLQVPLLYDCNHESIQAEQHGGETLWVHRHGASRALPAGMQQAEPIFNELGHPVPIPGNMGSDSFLALTAPGARQTFCSVAHGAGRVVEKDRAAEQFDEEEVTRGLHSSGVRLYRYFADNIAGQAPASFKSIHLVVEAMIAHEMIRPLARLRPRAVLKG